MNDFSHLFRTIWDKVFKNGPSKIYGRRPLGNFAGPILEYFVRYNPGIKTTKLMQWRENMSM